MKKLLVVLTLILALLPGAAMAYTINDAVPDSIGYPAFETYGMNVLNWTPGTNSGGVAYQLYTNIPQAGVVINGTPVWATTPADLFITENYMGVDYQWAIPLVSRTGFTAGVQYAVGTVLTSTDIYNANGGGAYNYNPNIPVQVATVGDNYGYASFGGGSVSWASIGAGLPDWMITVQSGMWEDDAFATLTFLWGTGTCANDILTGQVGGGGNPNVPVPPTVWLLGSGLLGMVGLGWRRRNRTNEVV
jgi:hypothetical protein